MRLHSSIVRCSNTIRWAFTKDKLCSQWRKQYYPDFNVGLEYLHSPMTGENGWSISAGITRHLPVSIGKADAQVQEASIAIDKSKAMLNATQNMVRSTVDDLYYKIQSSQLQMKIFFRDFAASTLIA